MKGGGFKQWFGDFEINSKKVEYCKKWIIKDNYEKIKKLILLEKITATFSVDMLCDRLD